MKVQDRIANLEQRVAGPPKIPEDDGYDGMTRYKTFNAWLKYRDPRGFLGNKYDAWRKQWDQLKGESPDKQRSGYGGPPDDGHDGMTQHDTFEDWLDYRDPRGHLQSQYDAWRKQWYKLNPGSKPRRQTEAFECPNCGSESIKHKKSGPNRMHICQSCDHGWED